GSAFAESGLPVLLPAAWLPPARTLVDAAALAAFGLLAGLRLTDPRPLELGPKHLYLAIVVAFHIAVFAVLDHLLAITATLTVFHNLQYHRIVWQYQRTRGRPPSLLGYLGAGLALGVVWYVPRVLGAAAAPSGLVRNLLIGLGWGVAFHHYLVDGRIW